MTSPEPNPSPLSGVKVRLAASPQEIDYAQRLRYKIFFEEFGAIATPQVAAEKRDFDIYDDHVDHLITIDESKTLPEEKIIGTYRLLPQKKLPAALEFYTAHEYNIEPLLKSGLNLLELGRSCVQAEYRTRPVMQSLWQGITTYVLERDIDVLFGCACFQGTNVDAIAEQLSYLHHYHLAPPDICPTVLPGTGTTMNLLPKEVIAPHVKRIFNELPVLIKGYLRLGCMIGDGAYIDHQFNSIDVCIIVQKSLLPQKYVKHYTRKPEDSKNKL